MKKQLIASLYFSIIFIVLIWLIFIIDLATPFYLSDQFGIQPRTFWGLPGIFFHPFLHGSLDHILNNTEYLFPLLVILGIFYQRLKIQVLFYCIIIPGLLLFFFGRDASHIGASGLVFALMGFLIVSGLFRKTSLHIILSIILFVMYGSLIYINMITFEEGLSTEGHIFGFNVGIVLAYIFRKEPVFILKQINK